MQNIFEVDPIPTVIPTPTKYEHSSQTGNSILWVVFVIMVVASGFFALLSWNIPVSKRLYHYVTTIITITASLAYFSMASGHGVNYHCIQVKNEHDKVPDTYHEVCREVYFARYVDWAITTPFLLVDLCLLAGIDGAHTIMAVSADLVMVLTGLFAAYGTEDTAQKWGWYAISCIAYIFVIWHVALHGSKTVKAKGNKVTKLFGSLALFTFILWTAYPIVWGFADGARKTSVDGEILAYAILDVLAKPIFGLWLLLSHRSVPETNVEIGGWWAHGLSSEGRIRIGDDDA
ncbi:hypothetical protein M406DRAFT_79672 [Cryphonectria parasitica EP155]|uniref:Opsin-1 n=1 Tax=Cryphonectria parasitica (strain ATCC 38755 / EP155) TaxID=660469 RepID=A0A9P5CR68_CRYP1|nr:uncharacterized protein M406DRAFT_79672 [Cryphonectria parasitica EP155]KAF3767222.1 hypothetical protein M406DRAFT_79672 [Cryphonectria parasitica EP155]